jgi:hypothetical protein
MSTNGQAAWDQAHIIDISTGGMPYLFEATLNGTPSTGAIRFNSATPASITRLIAYETDALGVNVDWRLDNLNGGDVIIIYSLDNLKYHVFQCNGEFVSAASVDTIPVMYLYGTATLFSASEKIAVRIDETGASMIGARMQYATCNYLL